MNKLKNGIGYLDWLIIHHPPQNKIPKIGYLIIQFGASNYTPTASPSNHPNFSYFLPTLNLFNATLSKFFPTLAHFLSSLSS